MNYTIDKINRKITIETKTKNIIVINEFDLLEKKFLSNTVDKYECELVLMDVSVYGDKMNVIETETKAFARRIGYSEWLMEFEVESYCKK
ncbi:MAG: hypothetical protein ACRCZ9_03460 [Fusobacteriaceae bacterium]